SSTGRGELAEKQNRPLARGRATPALLDRNVPRGERGRRQHCQAESQGESLRRGRDTEGDPGEGSGAIAHVDAAEAGEVHAAIGVPGAAAGGAFDADFL